MIRSPKLQNEVFDMVGLISRGLLNRLDKTIFYLEDNDHNIEHLKHIRITENDFRKLINTKIQELYND